MRPRVFPAEDSIGMPGYVLSNLSGFNEAAGIPRGRLPEDLRVAILTYMLQ